MAQLSIQKGSETKVDKFEPQYRIFFLDILYKKAYQKRNYIE